MSSAATPELQIKAEEPTFFASSQQAQSAYQTTRISAADPRAVEMDLLRIIIRRLTPFAGDDFTLTGSSAEALSDNLRFWDALSIDLLDPTNGLPLTLRKSLLELADFIRRHTLSLYRNEGTVDVLLDINRSILAGLMGNPGDQ